MDTMTKKRKRKNNGTVGPPGDSVTELPKVTDRQLITLCAIYDICRRHPMRTGPTIRQICTITGVGLSTEWEVCNRLDAAGCVTTSAATWGGVHMTDAGDAIVRRYRQQS